MKKVRIFRAWFSHVYHQCDGKGFQKHEGYSTDLLDKLEFTGVCYCALVICSCPMNLSLNASVHDCYRATILLPTTVDDLLTSGRPGQSFSSDNISVSPL